MISPASSSAAKALLGIATKIWCKLTPNPQAIKTLLGVFPTVDAARRAVTGLLAAGIIPAALEMIDEAHHPRPSKSGCISASCSTPEPFY